jgi:hypothetical protein
VPGSHRTSLDWLLPGRVIRALKPYKCHLLDVKSNQMIRYRPAAARGTRLPAMHLLVGDPTRLVACRCYRASDSSRTRVSMRPSPVISMRTVSPGTSHLGDSIPMATPLGVPVVMRSPGWSVVVALSHSMIS